MKGVKKLSSFLLIFTVICTIVPSYVTTKAAADSKTSSTVEPAKQKKVAQIVGELEEKRDANSKQFFLDDLSYEWARYANPIHYLKDGKWVDVDNSLEEASDDTVVDDNYSKETKDNKNVLKNKQNDYNISFAKNTKSSKLVSIQKDKYGLSWNVEGAQKATYNVVLPDTAAIDNTIAAEAEQKIKNGKEFSNYSETEKEKAKETIIENENKKLALNAVSTLEYKAILPNVDLNYNVASGKLKENIILNQYTKDFQMTFNLDSKGLLARLEKDNSISFYDEKDPSKVIFTTVAPFMYDKNDEVTDKIQVKLEEDNQGYRLTLIPDDSWMSDSSRAFPVVIDPYIQNTNSAKTIYDTFVCTNDTSNKYLNTYLRVGYNSSVGTTRSYIKFDLPKLSTSSMVTGATLSLYNTAVENGGSQVELHNVTSGWDSSNLLWGNQPQFDPIIKDYNIVNAASTPYNFDITSIAKSWYNTCINNGVMLKASNESSGNVAFDSSDYTSGTNAPNRPTVTIYYTDYAGLEDYFTYHSQDAGRAGTGYVNDYNGNLVFVHNDVSMSGNRLPAVINHVYNSCADTTSSTSTTFGKGWRLNLSQTVSTSPITLAGGSYYVYVDEDGTTHYFKVEANTSTYKDESGLNLTLTRNSDGTSYIKDKKDNKLTFAALGYLQQIEDNQGNRQYLNYTGTLLTGVIDGANRLTQLQYDSNGVLTAIIEPSGRKTSYQYTNGCLVKITYYDGNSSSYSYDSNNYMLSATNFDGRQIQYQYNTNNIQRVNKVIQYNTNGTTGQELNINYGFNTTTYSGIPSLFDTNYNGGGVNIQDMEAPDNSGTVTAIKLNKGASVPIIYSSNLSLKTNSNYTLEFDYWADDDNVSFNLDAYPDDLPEVHPVAMRILNHYKWNFSSTSQNMSNCNIRFFNNITVPNPSNIYIANVRLYETAGNGNPSMIRDSVGQVKTTYQFNDCGNTVGIKDSTGNAQYYEYYDKQDDTNRNKLSSESKLQGMVINYLSNHNFESSRDWAASTSGYGSCSYTSGQSYMGNSSVQITKSSITNSNISCNFKQTLNLQKGKAYTFSAYVKTDSISNQYGKGSGLFVNYQDAAGNWQTVNSQFITGTNDWQRIEETFTVPQNAYSGTVYVGVNVLDESGTAYFDCAQLEDGYVANRYNLVENAGMEFGSGSVPDFWGGANFNSSDGTVNNGVNGSRAVKITGESNKVKYTYQDVMVKGNAGDTFIVSGWGKADSTILSNREFDLFVVFRYTSGTDEYFSTHFNYGTNDWQYLSEVFVPKQNYKYVTVIASYTNNANSVCYDNIQLYKEEFGTTYQYDSNGNLQNVVDIAKQQSQYTYDSNNNLTKYTGVNGGSFNYTYTADGKHNVDTATSAENTKYKFGYDSVGNPTDTTVGDTYQNIKASAAYTATQNYMKSMTDSSGNTVTYNWNETRGLLDNLVDPKGKTTNYTYDSMDKLQTASKGVDGGTATNTYGYTNDMITSIKHNTQGNDVNYTFNYDSFGNNTSVNVGSQNLITNIYDSRNGDLKESDYANGNAVKTTYDKYGRVQTTAYNGTTAFKYHYDAAGNIGMLEDVTNNVTYRYTYDTINRLVKVSNSLGETTSYSYDKNNVSTVTDKAGGNTYKTGYSYDKDNRLSTVNLNSGSNVTYSYDRLGRLDGQTINTSSGISGNFGTVDSVAGNAANSVTKNISFTGRYIKLNITKPTQPGSDSYIRIPELEVYSNPISVIGKTAQANSYTNSNEAPKYAVDGNTSTKWCSPASTDASGNKYWALTVDLGQAMDIGKWTVKHAGTGGESTSYNTKDFKLQVSNDNVNFTDVDIVTSNTANVTERYVKTNGRYVRLYITTPSQIDNYARIYEFSVDGIDLALNKTTYSGGDNSPIEDANYMVDGLLSTHWCVPISTANWVVVDLGNTYTINKYVLRNAGDSGESSSFNTSDFTVQAATSVMGTKYEYEGKDKVSKLYLADNSSIAYTYDGNGNIATITQNGQVIKYYYNELNELTREDNQILNKTIVYTYDAGGNIQTKTEYPFSNGALGNPTPTINYGYTDTNWNDKLTNYNGQAITYDAIGNPQNDGKYSYTWQKGRQLVGITGNGQTISYKYNDSGIRTQKTVNGVTTSYHLVGDKVTYEDNGTDKVYYTYDSAGKLVSMNLNGVEYYYVRNAQGDIIGLIDKTGATVASYTYDSWGKLISIKDGSGYDITNNTASVGYKNPYRYRGYRYDTETGLYYLQSRYYNPEWGRFINADALGGEVGKLLSHNVFAYCRSNPVGRLDSDGYREEEVDSMLGNGGADTIGMASWAGGFTGEGAAGEYVPVAVADEGFVGEEILENNILVNAKRVTSPNGKKGGIAHQSTIQSINPSKGAELKFEQKFMTKGGYKDTRFADAVEIKNGKITKIYQVGKVNKNGLPVIRESRAIEDIMNFFRGNGVPIYFIPYNNPTMGPIIFMP